MVAEDTAKMTKTKDFITTLPQAASRGQGPKIQIDPANADLLASADSEDSGESGSLPMLTTLDSLPPNKVKLHLRACDQTIKKLFVLSRQC
jgi:hypothetical protein